MGPVCMHQIHAHGRTIKNTLVLIWSSLQFETKAGTTNCEDAFLNTFRHKYIFYIDVNCFRYLHRKLSFVLSLYKPLFLKTMSLSFVFEIIENNKTEKSANFQGNMVIFYSFIQIFVFIRNYHPI